MKYLIRFAKFLSVLAALLFFTTQTLAHCDTMDGPVIKAAQAALQTRNVNLVLIWIPEKDEPEVKQAFGETVAVRGLNRQARRLADRYFFETVVRLHRLGESEPYTGLKPAGTDPGPVIPVADKALDNGSVEPLLRMFSANVSGEIQRRFTDTIAKRNFNKNDVVAGRKYVSAYVSLLHYLEHLYEEKSS